MKTFLSVFLAVLVGLSLLGCSEKQEAPYKGVFEEQEAPEWQTSKRNGAIILFSDDERLAAVSNELNHQTACPIYDTRTRESIKAEEYNVFFLGFDTQEKTVFDKMPAFLEKNDFSDKAIVPFSVGAGIDFEKIWTQLEEDYPEAAILEGFEVDKEVDLQNDIENWLNRVGMIE